MPELSSTLNDCAAKLCETIAQRADQLGVLCSVASSGTRLMDFGIRAQGTMEAAVLLARVCLADLAEVAVEPSEAATLPWPQVSVVTDDPVLACMASQYAGWEVNSDGYFAMGSGPMRAVAAREALFESIDYREQSEHCVGVLEAGKLPADDVCRTIAHKCGVQPDRLTLLVAPTNSLAGTLQIAARSVETALHKLHELNFELSRVVRGSGSAPLPPRAENDYAAIGRTNDAILYGSQVTLEVLGDDQSLWALGPQVPSSSSADYGRPFAETLAAYDNDFYQVDPLLFSPAEILLVNVDTGNRRKFGKVNLGILTESFGQPSGSGDA